VHRRHEHVKHREAVPDPAVAPVDHAPPEQGGNDDECESRSHAGVSSDALMATEQQSRTDWVATIASRKCKRHTIRSGV
jgi:hypothetical protein